ncbi:MAG: beta-L-arabinofuranosidase domain-containing protein [Acidobacteriaceae bacterium]|jgi:hypothetical protein
MLLNRRRFLELSSIAGAGLLATHGSAGQLISAVTGEATEFAAPGVFRVKYFGRFSELPVGSVKARGWIAGWLERQLEGMTGHPQNLGYPYDTCMVAGKIPAPAMKHGENWWPYEQSSYFFDGSVRLGLLLDTPAAKKIPTGLMEYVLASSGPGKIGESGWDWPNTVAGRALMAEYSATADTASAGVLRDCLMGARIGGGRDGLLAEEALYLYGLTGDARLRGIAESCYDRYFLSDTKSFSNEAKIRGSEPLREHGVTAAEQLKLLPMMYSYTGDAQALELAGLAYKKVVGDSLMPDGGIVSSESMGTTAFNSMHETCDITDWSWSFGYMLMASGEGQWGDRIERATFNALPGAVTKDFRQLQYFSSANQVLASNTACPRIAMTRMSYRAAHDTECCTGNVNRAMPNYVTRMWMRSEDGLAAALYGPSEVRTKVKGRPVSVTETTDYPFRETVTFRVRLARPESFTLHLRIPEWCEGATVHINGRRSAAPVEVGTFAEVKRTFRDGDVIALRLPMKVAQEDWFGGSAAVIRRGPVAYSLKVAERRVESTKDPAAIQRVLKGNNIEGFAAIEFFPDGEWRYGVEAGLKDNLDKVRVKESPMTANPFLAETAPVRLSVPMRRLAGWAADWKPVADAAETDLKLAPKNPAELPTAAQMESPGEVEEMTLVPYGATHLRVTTLPVIPD